MTFYAQGSMGKHTRKSKVIEKITAEINKVCAELPDWEQLSREEKVEVLNFLRGIRGTIEGKTFLTYPTSTKYYLLLKI